MKQCFVVDDLSVICKVVCCIFEDMNFDIIEVEDGQQVFDECCKIMLDVIFLDWNMLVMDGLEFLISFWVEEGGEVLVVVFCIMENDVVYIVWVIWVGVNEYIMKFFDCEIVEVKFQEVGFIQYRVG